VTEDDRDQLRDLLTSRRQSTGRAEDLARQSLENQRTIHEGTFDVIRSLAPYFRLNDSLLGMLSASARSLMAAQMSFEAAVESREVVDKLLADLGES
jgi:hypothetical protein